MSPPRDEPAGVVSDANSMKSDKGFLLQPPQIVAVLPSKNTPPRIEKTGNVQKGSIPDFRRWFWSQISSRCFPTIDPKKGFPLARSATRSKKNNPGKKASEGGKKPATEKIDRLKKKESKQPSEIKKKKKKPRKQTEQ